MVRLDVLYTSNLGSSPSEQTMKTNYEDYTKWKTLGCKYFYD